MYVVCVCSSFKVICIQPSFCAVFFELNPALYRGSDVRHTINCSHITIINYINLLHLFKLLTRHLPYLQTN